MMTDLFSGLVAQVKPHLETLQDTCNQWGEVIVARLDAIHYAVLSEDFEDLRQRVPIGITPAEGRKPVAEIPVGHAWILESWFANFTTPGAFILRADDEPVFGKTTTTAVDSGSGNDLIVSGRATITIESVGATAGRVFLSYRRRIPGAGKARRFGGGQADPTPAHPRTLSPPNRHQPAFPPDKILTRQ